MSKARRPYKPQPFESSKARKDTSANIYTSMMLSPAWKDLTANQQILYLHMKQRRYGETNKTRPDPANIDRFTFPKRIWCNLFGLYSANNAAGFYRDRDALIEHGFIIVVKNGQNGCRPSEYQFSDRWKYWTKEHGLDIPPEYMSVSMLHKLIKDKN